MLRAGFDRPNLSFDVVALDGTGSKARKRCCCRWRLATRRCGPAIVYCGTRREVEEVSEQLRSDGLLAVGYHAGMPPDERAAAQHRFMEGDAEIVVATNAFGMGVDKADVRAVIHWAIPKSVEAYYQEVGRAGRDGRPARAILLSSRADLGRLINFIKRDVGRARGRARLRAPPAGCGRPRPGGDRRRGDERDRICLGIAERAGLCSLEPAGGGRLSGHAADESRRRVGRVASICREARDRAWRAYRAVEAFSSASGECRRRTLLDHFGDSHPAAPDRTLLRRLRSRTRSGCPTRRADAEPRARGAASTAEPVDRSTRPMPALFEALREWRLRATDGKPAYTVAHNRRSSSIAARATGVDGPSSRRSMASGPTFLERHGEQVLAVVGDARPASEPR